MSDLLKSLLKTPVFLACLPVVMLIRLLQPVIFIRIGVLRADRIGHLAVNTEKYLCQKETEATETGALDLFGLSGPVICNRRLVQMWRRQLNILPGLRFVKWANEQLPGGQSHSITMPSDQGMYGYQEKCRPHLRFTEKERETGRQYLAGKGMTASDKFICFFARDDRYLTEAHAYKSRQEWAYHDYRNASIHNHLQAVKTLAEKLGYYAFRMGYLVKDRIDIRHPQIIDYATNGDRTEFLDIFLCGHCYFFLQSGGSLTGMARAFHRPIVSVNVIPLQWCHGNPILVFIPKKFWLKKERRFLTFREIITSGLGLSLRGQEYEKAGIECIENTPEEITAAALEADQRLRGVWETCEEDEILQNRFQQLFPPDRYNLNQRNRIGAAFLRENQSLLR